MRCSRVVTIISTAIRHFLSSHTSRAFPAPAHGTKLQNVPTACCNSTMMENRPPPTNVYKHQAKTYLYDLFPRISCRAIGMVFQHEAFNFSAAFRVLTRIREIDRNEIGTVFEFGPGFKVFILKDRVKRSPQIRDPVLLAELVQIDELANTKENDRPPTKDDDGDDEKIDHDTVLECGCCFGEYLPNEMVSCSADSTHKICRECLENHVSEQVDGKNSADTPCIVVHDCAGHYTDSLLAKNLGNNEKLMGRYNETKIRAELESAGMSDALWTCQVCHNVGYFEEPRPDTVYCPECDKVYCTQCHVHMEEHKDKTCKEVERERISDVYRLAADAMTKATVRTCPNPACKKEFQIEGGCNKMKCICGTISCYLCRMDLRQNYDDPYKHFCHKFDCSCDQCHLYGQFEEQDRKARHAAGREVLEDAGVDPKEIERFLDSPTQAKKKRKKQVRNGIIPIQERERPHQHDRNIVLRNPEGERPRQPEADPAVIPMIRDVELPRQPDQVQEPPAEYRQDPARLDEVEAPRQNLLTRCLACLFGQ